MIISLQWRRSFFFAFSCARMNLKKKKGKKKADKVTLEFKKLHYLALSGAFSFIFIYLFPERLNIPSFWACRDTFKITKKKHIQPNCEVTIIWLQRPRKRYELLFLWFLPLVLHQHYVPHPLTASHSESKAFPWWIIATLVIFIIQLLTGLASCWTGNAAAKSKPSFP